MLEGAEGVFAYFLRPILDFYDTGTHFVGIITCKHRLYLFPLGGVFQGLCHGLTKLRECRSKRLTGLKILLKLSSFALYYSGGCFGYEALV